jgi:hypothetical protein
MLLFAIVVLVIVFPPIFAMGHMVVLKSSVPSEDRRHHVIYCLLVGFAVYPAVRIGDLFRKYVELAGAFENNGARLLFLVATAGAIDFALAAGSYWLIRKLISVWVAANPHV